MGFFRKKANFGSKILGGVKHAAQWIAPTLHKVLNTVAGPVGMIHPGIGAALGTVLSQQQIRAVRQLITNDIAYYIQYSKRGGNSAGGMLQNEDYQLFIDNDNALVYAANNQIIDGQASDFALKIAADVNQLQSTVGSIDADIVGVKNDIITIQQELARQQHFRGYYLLNSEITSLPDSADGDFAFSAESGTVWMYDTNWYNSGQAVPDQVSPASDAVPLVDNATGAAGVSNEYSRGDHQHPLQISSVLPSADTATGEAGTAATYARSNQTHHVNLSNDVPLKDSGTGTAGASNVYASSTHQHPLNVDPTVANVPLVNATAAANGTSDFYCRNDHVHPQQLTYTGPLTSTMFIKNGAQATDVLLANGDSKPISDIAGDGFVARTGKSLQTVQGYLRKSEYQYTDEENSEDSDDDDYQTKGTVENTGSASIQLGCSRSSNIGQIAGQWIIYTTTSSQGVNPLSFKISLASHAGNANRGLVISADGNTLTFNGKVL
ncbi:MAG: hypothetical protein EZS28_007347 [Streblomastix strix]|uniref:Uncharacterized protein n=1 Tax=Streblomastix strix TaxID=222440 RepID=A0A5J4WPR6_9EUKA|nr:MAG: hypothetical protein EZS28_007347 [Streblomastix strix]